MYASDVFRLMGRRWVVVLGGLLATCGVAFMAWRTVPPDYQLESSVLLLPPKLSIGAGANPYLALGGLDSTAEIVGRAVMSERAINRIKEAGGTGEFTVELDPTTSGPLLLATTISSDPKVAELTMGLVIDEIPAALERLQAGDEVKRKFRITSSIVSQDESPTVIRKPQLRVSMAVIAVGLAFTLFLAAILDSWLRRRARRKAERAAKEAARGAEARDSSGLAGAVGAPQPDERIGPEEAPAAGGEPTSTIVDPVGGRTGAELDSEYSTASLASQSRGQHAAEPANADALSDKAHVAGPG